MLSIAEQNLYEASYADVYEMEVSVYQRGEGYEIVWMDKSTYFQEMSSTVRMKFYGRLCSL